MSPDVCTRVEPSWLGQAEVDGRCWASPWRPRIRWRRRECASESVPFGDNAGERPGRLGASQPSPTRKKSEEGASRDGETSAGGRGTRTRRRLVLVVAVDRSFSSLSDLSLHGVGTPRRARVSRNCPLVHPDCFVTLCPDSAVPRAIGPFAPSCPRGSAGSSLRLQGCSRWRGQPLEIRGSFAASDAPWRKSVYSSGDFGGTGARHFVEPHPTDATKVIRYVALEGPESGTYFLGTDHRRTGDHRGAGRLPHGDGRGGNDGSAHSAARLFVPAGLVATTARQVIEIEPEVGIERIQS